MHIDMIADYACECGEGPLWHPTEQSVYWTDIPKGRLFRYNLQTGRHTCVMEDRPIGGYTLQADGSLLLFRDRGNIVTWRDGKILNTIIDEIPDLLDTRFNDVCANHAGGVYCGTMSWKHGAGRLYHLAPDGAISLIQDGYGTPNGMGYSPDNQWLYYNDSGQGKTFRWTYDAKTGAIRDPLVLRDAKTSGDPGGPDGMTIDSEGFIWTARWDGSALLRHNPADGAVCTKIDFPVKKVTSLCFAGDALDTMYVSTAGGWDRTANGPLAGALFRVTHSGFKGLQRPMSRVKL